MGNWKPECTEEEIEEEMQALSKALRAEPMERTAYEQALVDAYSRREVEWVLIPSDAYWSPELGSWCPAPLKEEATPVVPVELGVEVPPAPPIADASTKGATA
jgi:hypothetical protein